MWKGLASWDATNSESMGLSPIKKTSWASQEEQTKKQHASMFSVSAPFSNPTLNSHLGFSWGYTIICKPNEPCSPKPKLPLKVLVLYHSNRNHMTDVPLSFLYFLVGFYITLGWRPGPLVGQWLMVKSRSWVE